MLRMGRNPNEEKSQTQANDSSRSYSPYQSGEPQRTTEPAASTKARRMRGLSGKGARTLRYFSTSWVMAISSLPAFSSRGSTRMPPTRIVPPRWMA